MITFFTIPKAFNDTAARAQRNALRSWRALGDDIEVIVYGDDPGVAETAAELRLVHRPEVSRSDQGTPQLDGVFADAREIARNQLLCFANTDIVLLSDFRHAAERLAVPRRSLLAVGESWDTPVEVELDFEAGWERTLRSGGRRRGAGALDWFLFTRDLFSSLPPFAVGRIGFDNWLVWKAGAEGAMVVDLTPVVHAVHQRHGYGHVPGGHGATRQTSVDGRRNLELAGGKGNLHTRYDATHVLGRRGLHPNLLRVLRLKEYARRALYKTRLRTPWPPSDSVRSRN